MTSPNGLSASPELLLQYEKKAGGKAETPTEAGEVLWRVVSRAPSALVAVIS